MKVGILGAGFTGLAASYYLAKAGHDVTIIESTDHVGGLAAGFKEDKWDWSLEEHYHHWFTNDDSILSLASEINFPVSTYRPKTSILSEGSIYQFDSPASLLKFPHLSIVDKIRTATIMVLFKLIPFWKYLESVTAKEFMIRWGGKNAWEKLWGPLFVGKFGKYADEIPAVWFWARIKKRTPSLVYPDGGYKAFIDKLHTELEKLKVDIILNSPIQEIKKEKDNIHISVKNKNLVYDVVVCTLPTTIFTQITHGLPGNYIDKLKPLNGLGAVTLILSLNERFFIDNTYWLSINEIGYPFLAVVEHTNFVDSSHYGGEHLLYVGNYLPVDHEYFRMSANELLDTFEEHLRQINPDFNMSKIIKPYIFKAKFAQPIVPLNYSKSLPSIDTPIDRLYLANMQQVYPWDRGTNYAVELGKKVADKINKL